MGNSSQSKESWEHWGVPRPGREGAVGLGRERQVGGEVGQ